jgi:exopolyphosphatase / guanosine-5'-triphosphate,3'-diphosphate pyrophosphatase
MSRAAPAMSDVIAAVDLGSNSFHMVVARYSHGQLVIIDRLREMVRLGSGVGDDGRLVKEVSARALACLERFGQRLRDIHARNVRVVGTNALRVARRKQAFLERAREALGFPIEIVSGIEEARLIYSGVVHNLPAEPGRKLVIDIGGGSTELIIGERNEPLQLESLQMGCVSMSQRYFAEGRISAKRMERARLAARLELEPIQAVFLRRGWERVVGSSGTVRAIADSLRELDPAGGGHITPAGLTRLMERLVRAEHVRALPLTTVTDERRPVFPGGVVILSEIVQTLGIEQMRFAEGALRDGLLYDMVGRMTHADARERTVASMQRRYHVDTEQAERIENEAVRFLQQVQAAWGLDDALAELSLRWAARLHEIGLDVAHNGYHRHGAYLIDNADMPGFAREEQFLVARLVGNHRRKLLLEHLEDLIPPWDRLAIYLILLLRLSVLLHRGRGPTALAPIELSARARTLEVRFPQRWLREHPLTAADLQQETDYLRAHGLRLRVFERGRGGG